jgi:hypothetical protein
MERAGATRLPWLSFKRHCEVEPQQVSARVTDGLTAKLSAYEAGQLSLSPAEAVQLRKTQQLAQAFTIRQRHH